MISGQWFQRQGSKHWKILHKITHNSIKTRSSTLILNKCGRERNIHTKFATCCALVLGIIKKGLNKDHLLKKLMQIME